MYQVRFLEAAAQELARLDRTMAPRIVGRIAWLGMNFELLKPEALTGELSGLYKLRAGNYRIIYEPLHDERTLVIHQIGHRREIYRQR